MAEIRSRKSLRSSSAIKIHGIKWTGSLTDRKYVTTVELISNFNMTITHLPNCMKVASQVHCQFNVLKGNIFNDRKLN